MKTPPHIVLIGAGNVATHLGIALHDEGYSVSQVYSRTIKSAETLAKKIKSQAITDLQKLDPDAAIFIIAVKDDSIESIAKHLNLKDKIVVHTSGSVSIKALKAVSKNYGVLYPLQTFSKNSKPDLKNVPICIEASNKATAQSLKYFAKSISRNVQEVNSDQRKVIHLAAVFACNFSNHMYAIAEDILTKNKLKLDILLPLIEETANKIKNTHPSKAQTGPAIRGDKKTMEAHLKLLSKEKEFQKIYKLMSEDIRRKS